MAVISKAQLAEQQRAGSAAQLPFSVPLPKDRYSARIKSCNFGPSKSSGNNMLTFVSEFYYPEDIVAVDGKKYSIAGTECTFYFSFSDAALPRLTGDAYEVGFMEKIGLNPEIDINNPDTQQFIGKCFSAIFGSEKREQRKELTEADKAAGKKQGDLILKEDGSPDVGYVVKLVGSITETRHQPKTPLNQY